MIIIIIIAIIIITTTISMFTIPYNIFSSLQRFSVKTISLTFRWLGVTNTSWGYDFHLTVASIGSSESYLRQLRRLSEQSGQTFYKVGTYM
jgi:hypothetical protein